MQAQRFTDIHPRNPLYLHPSDTPGSIIIPQQLSGMENYTTWNNSMRVALLAQNKIGFIDGKCRKEYYIKDLEYEWEKCNAFVLSWITNSISKELANRLMFSSNAHSVWVDLKERFDNRDLTRIYQKRRLLSTGFLPNHKFTKKRVLDRNSKLPGYDEGNKQQNFGGNKKLNYEDYKRTHANNVQCVDDFESRNNNMQQLGDGRRSHITNNYYNEALRIGVMVLIQFPGLWTLELRITWQKLESHYKVAKISSFADLGYAVCGSIGRCTVDAMIVLSQAGFCISYLIFVANTLAHLFNNSVTNPIPTILGWSPKKVYIWSCFPLNSIPTLTRLAPLSIFVDVVDLGAMGVVMIEDVLIFLKNRTVLEAFDGFSVFFYDLGVLSVYVFEGVEWFYHWKQR
ncbi:Amino acid transporter ANTL2 [Capsicum annuum]|nr:Amino acid transporter ANTL2 [Capsicum annuum]